MQFINLTSTPLRLTGSRVIEPSGRVARCEELPLRAGDLDGIAVRRTCMTGRILGLPDPAPETVYIVFPDVAALAATQGRTDVLSPNTQSEDEPPRMGRGLRQYVPHDRAWREGYDATRFPPHHTEYQ